MTHEEANLVNVSLRAVMEKMADAMVKRGTNTHMKKESALPLVFPLIGAAASEKGRRWEGAGYGTLGGIGGGLAGALPAVPVGMVSPKAGKITAMVTGGLGTLLGSYLGGRLARKKGKKGKK